MSKQKYFKVPVPNWSLWQITKSIAVIILAFRVDLSDELIILLKMLIRLWSG